MLRAVSLFSSSIDLIPPVHQFHLRWRSHKGNKQLLFKRKRKSLSNCSSVRTLMSSNIKKNLCLQIKMAIFLEVKLLLKLEQHSAGM